jgi:hypothetical protein
VLLQRFRQCTQLVWYSLKKDNNAQTGISTNFSLS